MRWRARKLVDRRQHGIAELRRLARRLEHGTTSAGNSVMLVANAISMPTPAIRPSSETPL